MSVPVPENTENSSWSAARFYGPPTQTANRQVVGSLWQEKKKMFHEYLSSCSDFQPGFLQRRSLHRPASFNVLIMPKPLGNFAWVHQSWGWQLHSSLDLGSVVPMLLTDKSKAFPLPYLSPRVVACPSPGKVCVWAKWADKESAVCHKSKGPRLTWSCQVGFGCRGDLAEDRELSVVPATEATNWEKSQSSS